MPTLSAPFLSAREVSAVDQKFSEFKKSETKPYNSGGFMGRNDDFFSIPTSRLNEKTESSERFIQALDESGVSGDFRNLLETHFTSSWPKELGNIDKIEEALSEAQKVERLPDKVYTFVNGIFPSHQHCREGWDIFLEEDQDYIKNRYPSCIDFAKEVATLVFPKSPYGFYQCFRGCFIYNFEKFILSYAQFFYGKSCSPHLLLISDKNLPRERRVEKLLALFHSMAGEAFLFIDNLKEVFDAKVSGIGLVQETVQLDRAFEFLCGWVKRDARAVNHSESKKLLELIAGGFSDLSNCINSLQEGECGNPCNKEKLAEFKIWASNFLGVKKKEVEKEWCCNVCTAGLSNDDFDEWARLSYDSFLPLCQDLGEEQANILIAWGITKDLEKMKNPNNKDKLMDWVPGPWFSTYWHISPFKETWRRQLTNSIKDLPREDRLYVVGRDLGWSIKIFPESLPQYISLPQHFFEEEGDHLPACYKFLMSEEDQEWWNSFLNPMPDDEIFPKRLYPFWTIKMFERYGYNEDLIVHADKSLGIIRGCLSASEKNFEAQDIAKIIKILMCLAPEKAVRHILLLLCNSQQPYSTENLDIDRHSLYPQSMSEILNEFSAAYLNCRSYPANSDGGEPVDEVLELLSSIRVWVVKYCLSRLRLRKGEKAEQGNYTPEQIVEPSAIWRKAYLKVFEELGLDLQGKVHKTVFFIRKFDPAEDVRELAKTCYKAVRREHNKSATKDDIRRGLIAAYWWLLLAQRQSLGLKINKEEAIKTRRRLLRRP